MQARAFVLSLIVHVAVLLLATTATLPAWRQTDVIRVSLQPPGGSNLASPPGAVTSAEPAGDRPKQPQPQETKQHAVQAPRRLARLRPRPAPAPEPVAVTADLSGADSADNRGTAIAATGHSGIEGGEGLRRGAGSGGGPGFGGTAGGIDSRAFCVYCPEPTYPMLARRRGWKGTVDVEIVLLADGRVDSASVQRSSGYAVLDQEAVGVARRSRFRMTDAIDAPLHGRIEYRFELVE